MSPTKIVTPTGQAYFHVTNAVRIIEDADRRAMLWDGDVGHVRDEMTDKEWRAVYVALIKARKALEAVPA